MFKVRVPLPEEILFPLIVFNVKALIEVVAKVELPFTNKEPEMLSAVADALPNDEVAEAVIEVKIGLSETVMTVDVPTRTFCPPLTDKFDPTVSDPSVVVPVPPLETGNTAMDVIVPVPLPIKISPTEKVEVPVPPFTIGKTPTTLLVKSMLAFWISEFVTRPLNNNPPDDLTKPVPRDEIVVDPFPSTVNKAAPVEDAIIKGVEVAPACTKKLALGVFVPTPILLLKINNVDCGVIVAVLLA